MSKLIDKKIFTIYAEIFSYLDSSIPREDSNQAAHLQHMKLCFISIVEYSIFSVSFQIIEDLLTIKRTHSPNDNPLIIITVALLS